MIDVHQLRVFASVYKNRSFSRASEELSLTQPTVSDHIKTLEEELNCRLFDRLGRTIIPTKEADVLYRHALEVIEKTDSIKDLISRTHKRLEGELTIGASTIPGTYLMPYIVSKFQRLYPLLSFQIIISDSKEILQKILRHDLLIGVIGSRLVTSNVNYTPFLDDELIAVCSPDFYRERGIKPKGLTLKELVEFPFILREEGSGTQKETEKILEEQGLSLDDLKVTAIFGSTDAVKQAVKAGLGVAIVSKHAVKEELRFELLREIRLTDIQMRRKFYIVTHKKRTLPHSYSLFLEHLKT